MAPVAGGGVVVGQLGKKRLLAALVGGSLGGTGCWRFPGSSFQYNLPPFRPWFPNESPGREAFPVITG